jgi:hypothetical protein
VHEELAALAETAVNADYSLTGDGGVVAPEPATRLRQLLNDPRPSDPAWQDETGRMVGLTAVRFLSDEPVAALRDWALISLASALGSKSAKKRLPNPGRWATESPPDLVTLSELDERRAALGTLTKLKKAWAVEYAARGIQDDAIGTDLVPTLLEWVASSSPDRAALLGAAYPRVLTGLSDAARLRLVAKQLGKLPPSASGESPEALSGALEQLSAAVAGTVSRLSSAGDTATSDLLIAATLGTVQHAWRQSPGILLHSATQRAFQILRGALPKTKQVPPAEIGNAAIATVSMLIEFVRLGGRASAPYVQQLLPALAAAYPRFTDYLRAQTGRVPLFDDILSGEISASALTPESEVEAVFAGLLPAWDAYVAELEDSEPVVPLGAMLHRAAAAVGVNRVGEPGVVVPYVPSDHHLEDRSGPVPSHVRVLRPGVSVRRDGGAALVLVRALVAAEH